MVSGENEVEVKVSIGAATGWPDRLAKFGFLIKKKRVFESNIVFDTAESVLHGRDQLLRLRQVDQDAVLTWKGKGEPGPHKSRPEVECGIEGPEKLARILRELGYEPAFRYEKYRTEYARDGEGTVTLDETPMGAFLELEGPSAWIDRTAADLGFKPEQYLLESYGQLYRRYAEEQGVAPTNMVFQER